MVNEDDKSLFFLSLALTIVIMIRMHKRIQMIHVLNKYVHCHCLLFKCGSVKAIGDYYEIECCCCGGGGGGGG